MPSPRTTPSTRRFKPGTPVRHHRYGAGNVLGEWGPIFIENGLSSRGFASCENIYDCMFGVAPHKFLHCCRIEYLERI
jgi:hypothetical protein